MVIAKVVNTERGFYDNPLGIFNINRKESA